MTRAPEPEITPPKVESDEVEVVSVAEPSEIAPVPDDGEVESDPTVSLKSARVNVAPLPTTTFDELSMRFAAPSASVPPEIVVAPVYALEPDSVSVPEPVLVTPPVPELVPEKVVLLEFPPVVRVAEPSESVPEPDRAPTVSSKFARLNVALLATSTVVESPSTPDAPKVRVPAEIVVVPE